jgi:hypothetical protein
MLNLIFDYLLIAAVVAAFAAVYFKKSGTTDGGFKASVRVGLSWPLLLWGWISSKLKKSNDTTPPPADTTPPPADDKA